jgi:trk system potassium uptake protein TrkA
MNLAEGKISIVRSMVEKDSKAANKMIKDLMLPGNCVIMSIVRSNKVLLPNGSTYILPGDEVLSVVSDESKEKLKDLFDV